MPKGFLEDILIQSPDPKSAAAFYVENLGFAISAETPTLISLHGPRINLFIELGPPLGPILEVKVDNVAEARDRLISQGCTILKDEPQVPRIYIRDPNGLTYNLTT